LSEKKRAGRTSLPAEIRSLFWEYDARNLSWESDSDLVIGRILARGTWAALVWLRRHLSDEDLRRWLLAREGAGLSPQQLRYWQLMLDLPARRVTHWIRDPARQVWDRRAAL